MVGSNEKSSSLFYLLGFFNVTFTVGAWLEDTQVWVYFEPEDNFGFPDYYYVEPIEQQIFREP